MSFGYVLSLLATRESILYLPRPLFIDFCGGVLASAPFVAGSAAIARACLCPVSKRVFRII